MKGSGVFSSFSNASLFDYTGDIIVADNRARLDNLDKVVIRAEDFKTSGGGAEHMSVIEHPPGSGKYVANPAAGKDYFFDLPSTVFGNYYSLMMEGMVVGTFVRPKDQIIAIYPRNASYFQEKLTASPNDHEFDMVDGGGNLWLAGGQTPNKKIYKVDSWFKWQIDCMGKFFMETKITGSMTGVGDYDITGFKMRGQYDGYLADATTPKGLFRTSNTQYLQGNSYFRSPGKEYENTTNPAVLQLWPFISGYTMYKNSANKYIEYDADMVAAISAGTFQFNMMTTPQNTSRYLCTVRITGKIDFNPFWVFQAREERYNLGDFTIYGGHCEFPDDPDFKPFRIVAINPASGNQIWTYEDVPQAMLDKIDAGEVRCDIYINTVIPIFSGYPIPASNALILPQPVSGDMYDIRGFQANPPSVGDKATYGILLTNNDGVFQETDRFCKELVYLLDPKPSNAVFSIIERRKSAIETRR